MKKNTLGQIPSHSTAPFGRWLFVIAALAFTIACSNTAQQTGKAKKKSDDLGAANSDDDDSSKTKKSTSKNTDTNSGDDDDNTPDLGAGDGSDAAASALLADCGGQGISDAAPDKVIYQKSLKSLPITKKKTINILITINVTAVIETDLDVTVTGAQTVQDTNVKIVSIDPPAGRSQAETEAAKSSGKTTMTNVPFKNYVDLNKDKAWDGVLCTFVPITKIDNERGGTKTVATFDPPMPASVSPKAIAKRYETEIGNKRVFDGIKATISESSNPDLSGDSSLTGTITVEKVDANQSVDNGSGGTQQISSDIAYKVTTDFGSAAKTFALGFVPEVTYFISYSKKDLVANVADTTALGDNGGVVTFIHP